MAKKASAKGDKPKAKTKAKTKTKNAGKSSAKGSGAADALFKLAEHPIIADLIAVGATAAVAAIVKSKSDDGRKPGSSRAVKDAGKAAAAAIGARLMDEFKAVKQSATEAQAKAKS
ncbi:hypothetical protein [Sphingomonas mesophila]|uniref:hypothetical protein n=1 Tax=Sphingomonas mesophila TaxID=2303576 RepID=UPI000E57C073|nr:hypothetical protein [Sphingomonas mesophila]